MSVLGLTCWLVCRVDTIEALFEAPIDHIQGTLLKHGDRPKSRAVKGMGKKKTPAGQGLAGVLNRGAQKLKLRVCILILQPRSVADPRSS